MILTSPAFQNNGLIPAKYTCDGALQSGRINPELTIVSVPPNAKSLTLIMDDPDAVGGRVFTHWLLWNIDPRTEIIPQGERSAGSVEGMNDSRSTGYLGPCPPDKKPHRYFFKLYALDVVLDLAPEATKFALENAMESHILEKAELMGFYER